MVTAAEYTQIARDYLRDPPRFFSTELVGHGRNQAYEIPYININPADLRVVVDGEELTEAEYTLHSRDGFISFADPPQDGDDILIEGTYFEWINQEDFERFVGYALDEYNVSEGEDGLIENLETNPDLRNVIAISAMIEALWAIWTELSREMSVSTPEVSVPARERFSQVSNMLQTWEAELRKRTQMLNVGRDKIEVLQMRRVSRTTGRLVPVFESQEIEDRDPPIRVDLPHSDLKLTGDG